MNIGPEPSKKSTYSLPCSSQIRPPWPDRSSTSAGMLPKLPPGSTRLASSIKSATGSRAVWTAMVCSLLDGDEDRMAHLARDGLRQMALAVGVLDQEHLAWADNALLAVARGDFDGAVEIDDVLPPRRGVPGVIEGAGCLAEDDAGCREGGRGLATGPLVLPFDLDIAEVGLALVVDVEIVD